MISSATTETPQKEITEDQKKKLKRLLIDAVHKMDIDELTEELGLEKNSIQRVIKKGERLDADIRSAAKEMVKELSLKSKYPDEEVESDYGYTSYWEPRSITDQYRILKKHFQLYDLPDMDMIFQRTVIPAEGWFLIPRWEAIAESYDEAICKILAKVKKTGVKKIAKVINRSRCMDSSNHFLKETPEKIEAIRKQNVDQGNRNYTVLPAQFGIRHRGLSLRKANEEHFRSNEFSLGLFEIGVMLLTHPERLRQSDDLSIMCGGDHFLSRYGTISMRVPVLTCENGHIFFGEYRKNNAYSHCGVATAFFQ